MYERSGQRRELETSQAVKMCSLASTLINIRSDMMELDGGWMVQSPR